MCKYVIVITFIARQMLMVTLVPSSRLVDSHYVGHLDSVDWNGGMVEWNGIVEWNGTVLR